MKILRSIALIIIGLGIGLATPEAIARILDRMKGFDRGKEYAFNRVTYGMTEGKVIELLGNPWKRSDRFELAQMSGYEFEYAAAAKIGAKYFLMWNNSFDVIYAIGFDESGKAIFRARGST